MSKALELAKFGRETPPTGVVVGDSDAQTLSQKTFSDMPAFSSGTVNGVAYLNGSKVLTTASGLVFDGTNLGVGTSSPNAKLHVAVAGDNETTIARFGVTSSGSVLSSLKVLADPTASLVKFDATGAVSNGYQFLTGGSFRAQLTSSGYLSLGTTNATEVLTVSNSNYEALGLYRNVDYNSVGANGVRLYLGGYVGSTPTRTAYLDATMMTATTSRLGLAVLISGTLTESLRIDTNGSIRIGGTFAAISASAEKLTVDGGTSQATTLANTSDSYGTVYIKNRSNTAATIQPYLYFNDVDGGNRSGFGVKYTDASLHQFAQGGINWYTGSAGFSGLRATLNSTGLGIGTASPVTKVHIEGSTAIGTVGTERVLVMGRGISGGVSFQQAASFDLGRHTATDGVYHGFTRLDLSLKDDQSVSDYSTSVQVMSWLNSGKVGINTTSPAVELDVRNRARVGDGTNTLTMGYWDSTTNRIESVNKPLFLTSYSDSIRFGMSGSEIMRIHNNSYVGIGTTNPQTILDIQNAGTATLRIKSTSANGGAGLTLDTGATAGYSNQIAFANNGTTKWALGGKDIGNASGDKFSLYNYTAAANFFTVDTTGNVGIATVSPAATLHVVGTGSILAGTNPALGVSNPSYSGLAIGFDGGPNLAQIVATNPSTASMAFYTKPNGGAPMQRMHISYDGIISTPNNNFSDDRGFLSRNGTWPHSNGGYNNYGSTYPYRSFSRESNGNLTEYAFNMDIGTDGYGSSTQYWYLSIPTGATTWMATYDVEVWSAGWNWSQVTGYRRWTVTSQSNSWTTTLREDNAGASMIYLSCYATPVGSSSVKFGFAMTGGRGGFYVRITTVGTALDSATSYQTNTNPF